MALRELKVCLLGVSAPLLALRGALVWAWDDGRKTSSLKGSLWWEGDSG